MNNVRIRILRGAATVVIDVIDSVRFCLTSRWPKNAEALISIVRAFISSFVFTRVHRLCHSNHKTENLPTLSWL